MTSSVGSRRPPNGLFNHAALLVTRNAFSITGKQLMVEDQGTEGPILLEMSRPGTQDICLIQKNPNTSKLSNCFPLAFSLPTSQMTFK